MNAIKQKLCAQRRALLKEGATKSEKRFMRLLDSLSISYIFQKGFIKEPGFYIVDFYLPSPLRICVEIDGQIHDRPEIKSRDCRKDFYLTKIRGFHVKRIKNEYIPNLPSDKEKLIAFLKG
jgi:very-short-patch-repair endonuclease